MKNHLLLALIVILLSASASKALAEMQEYEIYEGDVVFVSKSTLETFDGKTDRISGSFSFDPENQTQELKGKIEVDMTSLKTGRKKRDKHMYENHLHVAQYPTSVFTAEKIDVVNQFNDSEIDLKISGTFDMHGVQNPLTPAINAKWLVPGEELEVIATFKVKLPDYDIPRPSFLIMKVAEEQEIEVKFKARKK